MSLNMGKMSAADNCDKMRLQTLHEYGLGVKSIVKAYPEKQWKLHELSTDNLSAHRQDWVSGRSASWQ